MYPAILVRQSHQQFSKQMNCKSVLKAGIPRARAKGRSDRTTQCSLLCRDRAACQRNAAHFTAQLTFPSGSWKRSSARHAKCFHLRATQQKARCSCFAEHTTSSGRLFQTTQKQQAKIISNPGNGANGNSPSSSYSWVPHTACLQLRRVCEVRSKHYSLE